MPLKDYSSTSGVAQGARLALQAFGTKDQKEQAKSSKTG
jgi:hypothetical protein